MSSKQKKLDAGQKHLLNLIARDSGVDGWTPVSHMVMPLLEKQIPQELVELERTEESGRGRARLTEQGHNILNAMA